MKRIIITESQLKKIAIREQQEIEDGTYMVLQNLTTIKNDVDKILSLKHKTGFGSLITGEHAWAGDHIATSKDDIEEVTRFITSNLDSSEGEIDESKKMEGKDPCWKGYEMVGTKKVKGREVPNCVPKKSVNENNSFVDEINMSDLESLRKINNAVSKQDVINWLNENDIDYYNLNDLELYLIYFESHLEDDEDLGNTEETDFEVSETLNEAEYQGRKVTLNKPTRGDVKKFKVFVKNDKGNVVKVNFGDPNMRIKKSNPERRKSFRARHRCDNPGPKWKSRYWACKSW